ncbi:MAG: hypothetical protein H5T63_11710, partial [Chloroflexi bacterium]|nr:hypothetical protein [Chloroflexota bacterium]
RLKVERIHIAPRTLELSPPEVQRRFPHVWAPFEELLRLLRPFPAGLVRFWLAQPGGHVVITHLPSCYIVGEQELKGHPLYHVAYVRLSDLANNSLEALVPIGHLFDHLLGNAGNEEGPWLSEGGGINCALQEVGASIVALFPLGYGFDPEACRDVRSYFARSFALYLQDRRALNVADPRMEKLLRTSLFADAFCNRLARNTTLQQ